MSQPRDLKYEHTMVLVDQTVRAWAQTDQKTRDLKTMGSVSHAMQALLGFLLDTFDGEITDQDGSKEIARRAFNNELPPIDPDYLQTLPDPVIPLVVIRQVMRDQGVRFSPAIATNWDDWLKRYSRYMFGA